MEEMEEMEEIRGEWRLRGKGKEQAKEKQGRKTKKKHGLSLSSHTLYVCSV
jgi:hypothetical protein